MNSTDGKGFGRLLSSLATLGRTMLARMEGGESQNGTDAVVRNFASAIASSPDAILTTGVDGIVTSWNEGAVQLFGYPEEEIVGTHVSRLVLPSRLTHLDVMAGQLAQGKSIGPEQTHMRHQSGRDVPVRLIVIPLSDAKGRIAGAAAVLHDVSEQVHTEQLLRTEKERAERASRTKDELIAVLSHELNTPLTPALIASEALGQDKSLSEHARRYVDVILRNIQLEARLIEDVLDFSRLATGRLRLESERTNPHRSLEHAVEMCAEDSAKRELEFRVELTDEDPAVIGDPVRLRQIFWNLLSNAMKFSPPGGRITVHSAIEDGKVVIDIADEGVGIAPHRLEKIFDPFAELQARRNGEATGLGLGLAVAKSLVVKHGGEISVSSDGLGRGACFTVTLPVVADSVS